MRLIGLAILTVALLGPAAAQETKRTKAPPVGVFVTDACRAKNNNEALRARCEGRLRKDRKDLLRAVPAKPVTQ